MAFSRKNIYGTSPLDIKNLNDNIKYLWKKVFGNIGAGDLMSGAVGYKQLSTSVKEDIKKNNDNLEQIKNEHERTVNKINRLETETDSEVRDIIGKMNDINTKKVSKDEFTSTITQLNNAILSRVSSKELESYILQTDKKIASKVSDSEFSSFKAQTSSELSNKVSSKDFTTYTTQTDKKIESIVESSGTINTLISQTNDKINLIVNGGEIDGDALVSAINMSDRKIKMRALNIDLDGYVTISDLKHGRTTIDGGCIDCSTIDADEIGSHITRVSKFINFDGSYGANGIGCQHNDGSMWIYSSHGITLDCPTERARLSDGEIIASREWVKEQLEHLLLNIQSGKM